MKRTNISILSLAVFAIACGNDPITNAGYFDDDVDRSVDQSVQDDHSQNNTTINNIDESQHNDNSTNITTIVDSVIIIRDTIKYNTQDTVHIIIKDTVKHTKIDTTHETVYDTVHVLNTDTLYKTVYDTVYKEVTVSDTVYKTIETAEVPRDTSIMLFDSTDNQITAKIYNGIVYKNVFYDTTKYKYNETAAGEPYNVTIETGWYSTYTKIYSTNRCGLLDNPTWNNFGWEDEDNVRLSESKYNRLLRRLPGWRLFNAKDANALRDYLERVISDDSYVYINTITKSDRVYEFEANVATRYTQNQAVKGKLIKYMCAYDL